MSRTVFALGALTAAALTGAGLAVSAELHHRRSLRLTRSLILPDGQTAADLSAAWNATADLRSEWNATAVERIRTYGGTSFACKCQRATFDLGAIPDDPPAPRTRVFHLTAPDAIRDALDQLQDILTGDAGPSMLPVIRASMTEALALLGERP
jgi:hypothetical protein